MLETLRKIPRYFPALITAFVLALAVWISAVTSQDPLEEKSYSTPVPIEIVGQDPNLVITSNVPSSISLVLNAPTSIWKQLDSQKDAVRAIIDLSGLAGGVHTVDIQTQIVPHPVRKVSQSPTTVTVTLEKLASKEFSINLVQRGSPAEGYQADNPTMSRTTATITGPKSLVNRVAEVRAEIDISQAVENVNRTVILQALDSNEVAVTGLTLVPDKITVNQQITQRFGYRNVVVNVIPAGQPANGYRLTNISVFPPAVTVYSANPQIITDLPGFIDLNVDITNLKDDLDIPETLDLPSGVSVVNDENQVLVRIGIAAIETSLTLPDIPVTVTGLGPGLSATLSPESVTVILSGPVALLDRLKASDVTVEVDLTDLIEGTHQVDPTVQVLISDLQVESVLPGSVEVKIQKGTATP